MALFVVVGGYSLRRRYDHGGQRAYAAAAILGGAMTGVSGLAG